jgi:cytoskeletal protein CcmA (bactofilin family)
MFNSKEAKKEIMEISNSNTHIAKGTQLTGNLETAGNIRIEGRITGNVICKAKVVLGDPAAVIDGNLLSQNAEIYGEVKGTVEITELLTLKASAVIHGDIITSKMVVEAGAVFNGTCKMGNAPKEIKLGENTNGKPAERPAADKFAEKSAVKQ